MVPKINWPQVVLFGDSLTQRCFDEEGGWGSMLAVSLSRVADVLNRGFSGYNTRWCLKIMHSLFDSMDFRHVAVVTVCLGANDSWNSRPLPYDQHVPLDQFKQNLKAIIHFFVRKGMSSKQIVLCTPPTYLPEVWEEFKKDLDHQSKSVDTLLKYVEVVRQVAAEEQTSFADVYEAFELEAKRFDHQTFFLDGLHLSKKGSKIFYETVNPFVQEMVQKVRGTEEINMPLHTEIDNEKF